MGFEFEQRSMLWRFWSRIRYGVVLVVLYGGSLVMGIIANQTIKGSNSSLGTVLTELIHQPLLQRTALSLFSEYTRHHSISFSTIDSLYRTWFSKICVKESINLLGCELFPFRHEIKELLGYNGQKIYLILLQNSAEVRPNGGFYGSFIRVEVESGSLISYSVHDSYEVLFDGSGTIVNLPEWTTYYLGSGEASFVASNKFGFTDRDGRIAASLYSKTYNTRVDGVFFLSTNTILTLFPDMQYQLWKRQFMNASIDLIRGSDTSFKKELYLKELKTYIASHKITLFTTMLTKLHEMINPGMVQMYFSNISSDLVKLLQKYNLNTSIEPQSLYLWDINHGYNKISSFVIKTVSLYHDNQLITSTGSSIIALGSLPLGKYYAVIDYQLFVPQRYKTYMTELEKEYRITLTNREKHILGLNPLLDYRSVVFAGTGIELVSVTGTITQSAIFDAPPGEGLMYHIVSTGDSRSVRIDFLKK